MKSPASIIRTHRILACFAILHALLLLSWLVLRRGSGSLVEYRLWFGFATLWVFWPIVLILHPGRTFARVAITVIVSTVILYPSFRDYRDFGPGMFGLPEGVGSLSPHAIWDYFTGYRAGRAEAQRNLRSGHLVHEEYGMPKPPEYYEIVHQRYQIELHIYGDLVTEKIIGHVKGYNEIADPEIKRRFGSDVLGAASDEAFKHWNAAQTKQNP